MEIVRFMCNPPFHNLNQIQAALPAQLCLNFRDRSAATGGEKGGGHASSLTSGKTNAHDADRGKGYGISTDQTSGAPQIGGTAGF